MVSLNISRLDDCLLATIVSAVFGAVCIVYIMSISLISRR